MNENENESDERRTTDERRIERVRWTPGVPSRAPTRVGVQLAESSGVFYFSSFLLFVPPVYE